MSSQAQDCISIYSHCFADFKESATDVDIDQKANAAAPNDPAQYPPPNQTMSMYGSPNGMPEPHIPKASQACMSCRKQKRKCNKALPACALCERMNRHCDYSDASPNPTSEEFHALSMKVVELEARLNGPNSMISPPTTFATPSSTTLSASDSLGQPLSSYNPPQDYAWQGIQNKFPAIAVLDKDTFKDGG